MYEIVNRESGYWKRLDNMLDGVRIIGFRNLEILKFNSLRTTGIYSRKQRVNNHLQCGRYQVKSRRSLPNRFAIGFDHQRLSRLHTNMMAPQARNGFVLYKGSIVKIFDLS